MMSPAISTEPAAQTRETRRSLESSAESLSMRTGRSSPAVSEVTKDKEEEEVNLEVSKIAMRSVALWIVD